jgi:serine/threonine protein kinase
MDKPERSWIREKTAPELAQQAEEVRLYKKLHSNTSGSDIDYLRIIRSENVSLEAMHQEVHEKVDQIIEGAVLEGNMVGEGRDGIVIQVLVSRTDPQMRPLLEEEGIALSAEQGEAAVKVLKVYRPGEGKHEYDIQRKAHEVLSKAKNIAQVPAPITIRDQQMPQEAIVRLNLLGAHLEDNVEILMMDFIEGRDFTTMMYDFVLATQAYTPDVIEDMSFSQKRDEVGKVVGVTFSNRLEDEYSIILNDERLLVAYLRKHGFRVDPAVFEKLERAIEALHTHDIYHNDLHGRNVMISEEGNPYIIDFGRSVENAEEHTFKDLSMVQIWKQLSVSPEEERNQKMQREIDEFETLRKRLDQSRSWSVKLEKMKKDLAEGNRVSLNNELRISVMREQEFRMFLVALKNLVEDPEIPGEYKLAVCDFVQTIAHASGIPPFAKNMSTRLVSIGYFDSGSQAFVN